MLNRCQAVALRRSWKLLAALTASIYSAGTFAGSASVSTLYDFPLTDLGTGGSPSILTLGSDGSFYGTSQYGGEGYGNIFKISTQGAFSALVSFNPTSSTAGGPLTGVIEGSDSVLYGTIEENSETGGLIYSATTTGDLSLVYQFDPLLQFGSHQINFSKTGTEPDAALVLASDGNLYGSTSRGGKHGRGTLFKLQDSSVQTIYSFGATPRDGSYPQAPMLLGNDGNLYGSTTSGGKNNRGAIFKVTADGSLTLLYSFSAFTAGTDFNSDGASPESALTEGADGNFYGVTSAGGANGAGTIFKISPQGVFTRLYSFAAIPYQKSFVASALALGTDGNFYGALSGTAAGTNGTGEIYSITSSGSFTEIYAFSSLTLNLSTGFYCNSDGANPNALVVGSDGALYGTAHTGGTNGAGTIFKVLFQ